MIPMMQRHPSAVLCLQIHLKRKHWDSSAEQGRSSKRCTDIYERQMSDASGNRAQASSSVRQPAPQRGSSTSKGGGGKQGSEAVQRLRAQQAAQAKKLAQVVETSNIICPLWSPICGDVPCQSSFLEGTSLCLPLLPHVC